MSVGPLGGLAQSAAGSPLAQTKGSDVERAQHERYSQPTVAIWKRAGRACNHSGKQQRVPDTRHNRRYRQNKQIILALLNNPRTPVGVSLSLGINGLSDRELVDLSKNRNVPGAISRAATQILDRRKGPVASAGGGR